MSGPSINPTLFYTQNECIGSNIPKYANEALGIGRLLEKKIVVLFPTLYVYNPESSLVMALQHDPSLHSLSLSLSLLSLSLVMRAQSPVT